MLLNAKIQDLIDSIFADSHVTPAEIEALHKAADDAEKELLAHLGYKGTFHALLRSFEVTNQLMQESALKIRADDNITDTGKAMVYAAIEANIKLLEVSLQAFAD